MRCRARVEVFRVARGSERVRDGCASDAVPEVGDERDGDVAHDASFPVAFAPRDGGERGLSRGVGGGVAGGDSSARTVLGELVKELAKARRLETVRVDGHGHEAEAAALGDVALQSSFFFSASSAYSPGWMFAGERVPPTRWPLYFARPSPVNGWGTTTSPRILFTEASSPMMLMSTVFARSWRPPRPGLEGRSPQRPFVSAARPTSLHSCATARTTRSWVRSCGPCCHRRCLPCG